MAIDSWLLEASLLDPAGAPALRFYRWSRPTLSLGFHQRFLPAHWRELARSGAIELVRRPSGGRAVLHGATSRLAMKRGAASTTCLARPSSSECLSVASVHGLEGGAAMPDAILLDWNMPMMNGVDFLRQLRLEPDGQGPCVV
jgi:CheY-like chemotaxis protein